MPRTTIEIHKIPTPSDPNNKFGWGFVHKNRVVEPLQHSIKGAKKLASDTLKVSEDQIDFKII